MLTKLELKSMNGIQCLPLAHGLGTCMLADRLLGKDFLLRTHTNQHISWFLDRLIILQHHWKVVEGRMWA